MPVPQIVFPVLLDVALSVTLAATNVDDDDDDDDDDDGAAAPRGLRSEAIGALTALAVPVDAMPRLDGLTGVVRPVPTLTVDLGAALELDKDLAMAA